MDPLQNLCGSIKEDEKDVWILIPKTGIPFWGQIYKNTLVLNGWYIFHCKYLCLRCVDPCSNLQYHNKWNCVHKLFDIREWRITSADNAFVLYSIDYYSNYDKIFWDLLMWRHFVTFIKCCMYVWMNLCIR